MLTHARLIEMVHYDPETGSFTHLVDRQGCRAGGVAGCVDGAGYLCLKLDQQKYYAHRLAWLYVTGEWPSHEVDHKDRNRANNKWLNLRPATDKQQAENRKLYVNSTSGFRGVVWREAKRKWEARIRHNDADTYLGLHDTLVDAVVARLHAERALYTHAEHCSDSPAGAVAERGYKPAAIRSDASSGFRGVTYLPEKSKWLARIALQGRRKHLGVYDTIIDAAAARLRAERDLFTHAPSTLN